LFCFYYDDDDDDDIHRERHEWVRVVSRRDDARRPIFLETTKEREQKKERERKRRRKR